MHFFLAYYLKQILLKWIYWVLVFFLSSLFTVNVEVPWIWPPSNFPFLTILTYCHSFLDTSPQIFEFVNWKTIWKELLVGKGIVYSFLSLGRLGSYRLLVIVFSSLFLHSVSFHFFGFKNSSFRLWSCCLNFRTCFFVCWASI